MSDFTHIVRFVESRPHEVHLRATSDAEALGIAKRLAETLSPSDRARNFVTSDTKYERFEVKAILKPFNVTAEARVIYEIGIDARDQKDAEEKAEDLWLREGAASFSFADYLDLNIAAEEVER